MHAYNVNLILFRQLSVVLLAILITACGGTFLIEQPGGSYMEFYDKMEWLYRQVPVTWLLHANMYSEIESIMLKVYIVCSTFVVLCIYSRSLRLPMLHAGISSELVDGALWAYVAEETQSFHQQ